MIAIDVHSMDEFEAVIRKVFQMEVGSIESHKKEERILTRQDIQKLFNIGETTLWKRMKDGSLPYFKIGRKVFFRENEVRAALKNSNQG